MVVDPGDEVQRRAVVAPRGEIDVATRQALKQALFTALAGEADLIVVDLRAVTLLDSSGLSEIISCRMRASQTGRTLRVVNANAAVFRLFETTGLTEFLLVSPVPPLDRP